MPPIPRLAPRSSNGPTATAIILGSVLGGAFLTLVCVLGVLGAKWRRRGSRSFPNPSNHTPNQHNGENKDDYRNNQDVLPRPSDARTVRPVTPSPRRLATPDAGTVYQQQQPYRHTPQPAARRHLEKAGVTAPSDHHHHPAVIPWLETQLHRTDKSGGGGGGDDEEAMAAAVVVSTAFAAEMSSLLESISLKSSYDSLREGDAPPTGLGVPPRMALASVHLAEKKKERQGSGSTAVTATATGGGGDGMGPVGGLMFPAVPTRSLD